MDQDPSQRICVVDSRHSHFMCFEILDFSRAINTDTLAITVKILSEMFRYNLQPTALLPEQYKVGTIETIL